MKPEILENHNTKELTKLCKQYIDYLDSEYLTEDGLSKREPYIFEQALKTIFGDNVFDYVNSKIE